MRVQAALLLGAFLLCGAQGQTTAPSINDTTAGATTVGGTTRPDPNATMPSTTTWNATVPVITTWNATTPDATTGNATTGNGTTQSTTTSSATTTPPVEGLSDGAIAGIAIGSIAGVGAIGGGVFGLLKYTGKI